MSKAAACIAILLALDDEEEKKIVKRKVWMKEWLKKRNKFTHENLLQELLLSAPADYKNFLRMDRESFMDLLEKTMPLIQKTDTISTIVGTYTIYFLGYCGTSGI